MHTSLNVGGRSTGGVEHDTHVLLIGIVRRTFQWVANVDMSPRIVKPWTASGLFSDGRAPSGYGFDPARGRAQRPTPASVQRRIEVDPDRD